MHVVSKAKPNTSDIKSNYRAQKGFYSSTLLYIFKTVWSTEQ